MESRTRWRGIGRLGGQWGLNLRIEHHCTNYSAAFLQVSRQAASNLLPRARRASVSSTPRVSYAQIITKHPKSWFIDSLAPIVGGGLYFLQSFSRESRLLSDDHDPHYTWQSRSGSSNCDILLFECTRAKGEWSAAFMIHYCYNYPAPKMLVIDDILFRDVGEVNARGMFILIKIPVRWRYSTLNPFVRGVRTETKKLGYDVMFRRREKTSLAPPV